MKSLVALLVIILCMGVTLSGADKSSLEKGVHMGRVIQSMDSGGYTYIQFEEKGKKMWVAARQMKVVKGDTIEFGQAAPMKNFFSKTLNKTFETILFVGAVKVNGKLPGTAKAPKMSAIPKGAKMPKGHVPIAKQPPRHPNTSAPKKDVTVEPGSIKKATDGYTVSECYTMQESLKGKIITIRGKVVKFNSQIMGKNWLHIRDGSGKQGTNDLTVTTQDKAMVGDTILVTGKIVYDKDFGSGYKYRVIMEEAKIKVQ